MWSPTTKCNGTSSRPSPRMLLPKLYPDQVAWYGCRGMYQRFRERVLESATSFFLALAIHSWFNEESFVLQDHDLPSVAASGYLLPISSPRASKSFHFSQGPFLFFVLTNQGSLDGPQPLWCLVWCCTWCLFCFLWLRKVLLFLNELIQRTSTTRIVHERGLDFGVRTKQGGSRTYVETNVNSFRVGSSPTKTGSSGKPSITRHPVLLGAPLQSECSDWSGHGFQDPNLECTEQQGRFNPSSENEYSLAKHLSMARHSTMYVDTSATALLVDSADFECDPKPANVLCLDSG